MRHLNVSEAQRQANLAAAGQWATQAGAQGVVGERYPYTPTVAPGTVPLRRSGDMGVSPNDAMLHQSTYGKYQEPAQARSYMGYAAAPQSTHIQSQPMEYNTGFSSAAWGSRDGLVQGSMVRGRQTSSYGSDDGQYSAHGGVRSYVPPEGQGASAAYGSERALLHHQRHQPRARQPAVAVRVKQEFPEDLSSRTTEDPPETPTTPSVDSVPPTPDSDRGSEASAPSKRLVHQDKCAPTTAKPPANAGDIELCLICGDKASGFHYNALSCEGCKGFFRRSVTRNATYACKYGGKCEMDMWMRRRCQACRLRRCKDVGMREECLLSERQCSARNARRHYRKQNAEKAAAAAAASAASPAANDTAAAAALVELQQLQKKQPQQQPAVVQQPQEILVQQAPTVESYNNTEEMHLDVEIQPHPQYHHALEQEMDSGIIGHGRTLNDDDDDCCMADSEGLMACGRQPMERILEKLSPEHKAVVKCLMGYQDKYELPSVADLAKLSEMKVNSENEPADMADAVFLHMVEMTILVTRLVINFAKSLPGFLSLSKDDQIVLLKGSASEVMMLRTARRYDPQTDTVVFGNGTPFSANAMEFGGLQGYIDNMFEFSRGMSRLMIDDAEYALLTAMTIFSVRPGVKDVAAVEQIQEIYLEVLLSYLSQKR